MQCAACQTVFTDASDECPRYEGSSAAAPEISIEMTQTQDETLPTVPPDVSEEISVEEQATPATGSTLIEFPGARSIPQWRKELSERVREIQQRREREAALESAQTESLNVAPDADEEQRESLAASRLGLVPPPPEAPELNPLVAAALRRIERVRQQYPAPPVPRTGGRRGAAAAVARVAEESYEPGANAVPAERSEQRVVAQTLAQAGATPAPEGVNRQEPSRGAALIAVPKQGPAVDTVTQAAEPPDDLKVGATVELTNPTPANEDEGPAAVAEAVAAPASKRITDAKPAPRRVVDGVIDDAWLSRLEERILPPVAAAARTADDSAPIVPRLTAGLLDLLIVAFLSSPFAAVIELTNGDWGDGRVVASMCGIVLVSMFLYLTVSTALAGRTFAMSIFRLQTVDAETALAPRLGQCVRRTLVYMLSLATFGLGIIYALFDAERRAAHDHLSGTVVVRELP